MRPIIIKYAGDCRKCGATLEVGDVAVYEKRVGVFCPPCAPTDTEEIRTYRQEGADRKADKLDEWAEKREKQANAALNSYPEIRHDWAFVTQPGHIPFRARMNRADHKAIESLGVAEGFRQRADGLRHVRVAGDAERRRQTEREALDKIISKGSRVYDVIFGEGVVVGVHSKSYRVKFDRGFTHALDKSSVRPIAPSKEEVGP